ncbi:hypothetical protein JTB14_038334 [Gonioctena quinquepunctata]|nr:hypothetical protein JTB14_038334 [Gonioctena quinquepunctata]
MVDYYTGCIEVCRKPARFSNGRLRNEVQGFWVQLRGAPYLYILYIDLEMEGTFESGPTVVAGNDNKPARRFGSKDVILRHAFVISVKNEDCGLATQIGVRIGGWWDSANGSPHPNVFRRIARPCEAQLGFKDVR